MQAKLYTAQEYFPCVWKIYYNCIKPFKLYKIRRIARLSLYIIIGLQSNHKGLTNTYLERVRTCVLQYIILPLTQNSCFFKFISFSSIFHLFFTFILHPFFSSLLLLTVFIPLFLSSLFFLLLKHNLVLLSLC